MAGSLASEVSRGFLGDPDLKVNEDGTVQFDSSSEPLARVRPFEQGSIASGPLRDRCCDIPNPVTHIVGSGADLLTTAPVASGPDSDDTIGGSPGYKPNGR